MEIEELITEMIAVQASHPALTISEVIRIFNVKATQDLTIQIQRLVTK